MVILEDMNNTGCFNNWQREVKEFVAELILNVYLITQIINPFKNRF
jgi:hypothetical protein